MDRETINKILELHKLKEELNNLRRVLNNGEPTKITITNNVGFSKSFDSAMINRLKDFAYRLNDYINKSFEEL